ncbi:MAG: hypothetical protein ACTSQ8_08150 [Candidatus Helarchaeota archaeon]
MPKTITMSDETHHQLDLIRVKDKKLRTFEDVIKKILKEYKNHD